MTAKPTLHYVINLAPGTASNISLRQRCDTEVQKRYLDSLVLDETVIISSALLEEGTEGSIKKSQGLSSDLKG